MGGSGSGRGRLEGGVWKGASGRGRLGRNTTNRYRQIDVRTLQRGGDLTPGRFIWQFPCKGEPLAIKVQTSADRLTLRYQNQGNDGKWKDKDCSVQIEWTPCNYGEARAWFLCPAK